LPDSPANLQAVQPWHLPVKDGKLWSAFGLQGLPGFVAIPGDDHIVAPPDQVFSQEKARNRLVFGD
jgi:hypothetical protein